MQVSWFTTWNYTRYFKLIDTELFWGHLEWSNETEGDPSHVPEILPLTAERASCPTRHDVLNTVRSQRWKIWDDRPNGCVSGCFLKWCNNEAIAPCCVKRQTAKWRLPCESLPLGCYNPHSDLVAKHGAVVHDRGMRLVPTLSDSDTCPTRSDVLNTPKLDRWRLWNDKRDPEPECTDGCRLMWCRGGKAAPCCVKRRKANWSVPCSVLPKGCHDPQSPVVVQDIGELSTPVVEQSSECPSYADVANTRRAHRWSLWDDGTPPDQIHGGARCQDGCAMPICRRGHENPCCVKRLKVIRWPLPCKRLRHGECSSDAPPPPVFNSSANTTAAFGVGAGAATGRAQRARQPLVRDWHAIPDLVPSDRCPTRDMIINTYGARRWAIWDDPTGVHDCRFALANSMAPLQVKRLRVFAWPVPCEQLPYGCQDIPAMVFWYNTPLLRDMRVGAKTGSRPWLRARYGADATYWQIFGKPATSAALIWMLAALSCTVAGRELSSRPTSWRFVMARWSALALLAWAMLCVLYLSYFAEGPMLATSGVQVVVSQGSSLPHEDSRNEPRSMRTIGE